MPNLMNCRLKLDLQNVDQHTRGKWLIPGTKHYITITISGKVWNYTIEYPSAEYKFDKMDPDDNTFSDK